MYFLIFLILVGFTGITFALEDEISNTTNSLDEHYEIEIFGLKDEYVVGEEYSFYYVISGNGFSCGNYDARYPDENGNTVFSGVEVLCAPEKSMHKFKINSFDRRETHS